MSSLLVENETCWRIAGADRVSVIVDAAGFFEHARNAMLKAERLISRSAGISTRASTSCRAGPMTARRQKLGSFLNWLAKRRDALDIRILERDVGLINSITRGETPFYILGWMFSKKVHLKLDGAHPPLSAHHMKLLVIDDKVAFCGGIDMTVGRWDTRDHLDNDKRRRSPMGFSQGPWHDATTCLSGSAAAMLSELARIRWEHATKEKLDRVETNSDPWPDGFEADFRDIDIGIARTLPEYEEQSQVSEIEAAKLTMIAAAREHIYIESQYFGSRTIAEAIAARLREPDGPEVVVINPKGAEGWLGARAMDSGRISLMKLLREADRHGRFRLLYPVNDARNPIYVHAKIMIIDDRILKLGSANLNNRSMGYDTGCDVIITPPPRRS